MRATMRISARNGQDVPSEGILLDAFGLAALYSTLCEQYASRIYSYEGVQFWRANGEFVVSYREQSFTVDNNLGLEEFNALLLEQKAS